MPSMISSTQGPSYWQQQANPVAPSTGPSPLPAETPIPYAPQPAEQPAVAPTPLPDLYGDDAVCTVPPSAQGNTTLIHEMPHQTSPTSSPTTQASTQPLPSSGSVPSSGGNVWGPAPTSSNTGLGGVGGVGGSTAPTVNDSNLW